MAMQKPNSQPPIPTPMLSARFPQQWIADFTFTGALL